MNPCACEKCGHPLPDDALPGVTLSKMHKRIFKAVSKATPRGITTEGILEHMYFDDPNGGPNCTKTVAVQINRLNRLHLRPRGMEIRSPVGTGISSYTLRRLDNAR